MCLTSSTDTRLPNHTEQPPSFCFFQTILKVPHIHHQPPASSWDNFSFCLLTCLKSVQVLGFLKKMFPVCNSWVVRHETKDKANLFLKAKLLDLFPAGAHAVNVSEKWQSPLRCTGKLRYFREVAQCNTEGND